MPQAVIPKNGIHLTLEDVQEHFVPDDNIHNCPTRVVSLENTLNGMLMPLPEVRRISKWAREHEVKVHCDGARLWEAVAAGEGSLVDFAENFDTLSLCFSKGLGAPVGSVLVGSKKYIKHARWTRKAIGGGMRQSGVVTAAARVAVDETFGQGPNGDGGLLRNSHEMAKRIEKMWTELGGKVIYPVHTNMVWLDLKDAGSSDARISELGKEQGLKLWGSRLIIHYQIYQNADEVIPRLDAIFKKIFEEKKAETAADGHHTNGHLSVYK